MAALPASHDFERAPSPRRSFFISVDWAWRTSALEPFGDGLWIAGDRRALIHGPLQGRGGREKSGEFPAPHRVTECIPGLSPHAPQPLLLLLLFKVPIDVLGDPNPVENLALKRSFIVVPMPLKTYNSE